MKNQIIKMKVEFLNEFLLSIGTLENAHIMINETISKYKDDFEKTAGHFKEELGKRLIRKLPARLEPTGAKNNHILDGQQIFCGVTQPKAGYAELRARIHMVGLEHGVSLNTNGVHIGFMPDGIPIAEISKERQSINRVQIEHAS